MELTQILNDAIEAEVEKRLERRQQSTRFAQVSAEQADAIESAFYELPDVKGESRSQRLANAINRELKTVRPLNAEDIRAWRDAGSYADGNVAAAQFLNDRIRFTEAAK